MAKNQKKREREEEEQESIVSSEVEKCPRLETEDGVLVPLVVEEDKKECPPFVFDMSEKCDYSDVVVSAVFVTSTGKTKTNSFSVKNCKQKEHPIAVFTNKGQGGKFNKSSVKPDSFGKEHLMFNINPIEKENIDNFQTLVVDRLLGGEGEEASKNSKQIFGKERSRQQILADMRTIYWEAPKLDKDTKKETGEKWPPSVRAAITKETPIVTESGLEVHFLNLDGYEWTKISVELPGTYYRGSELGFRALVKKVTVKDKVNSSNYNCSAYI